VHHIDRDNGNNDVFNLVPLCPDCHKLAHKLHVNIEIEYSAALRDQLQFLELHF
jgi:predicted HNH restriction endonuclease